MQITIVQADNVVTVDGESYSVDCSSLDPGIRVIQWYGEKGEIEFDNEPGDEFKANEKIDSFEPFIWTYHAWVTAKNAPKPSPPSTSSSAQYEYELEARAVNAIRADFDRAELLNVIRSSDAEGIKAYVNQTVGDLDDVKRYLARLTLLVAGAVRK